jgi:hypothetical protein
VKRPVKAGAAVPGGVRVEGGLNGGEDLIVNPPGALQEGDRVRRKE